MLATMMFAFAIFISNPVAFGIAGIVGGIGIAIVMHMASLYMGGILAYGC